MRHSLIRWWIRIRIEPEDERPLVGKIDPGYGLPTKNRIGPGPSALIPYCQIPSAVCTATFFNT